MPQETAPGDAVDRNLLSFSRRSWMIQGRSSQLQIFSGHLAECRHSRGLQTQLGLAPADSKGFRLGGLVSALEDEASHEAQEQPQEGRWGGGCLQQIRLLPDTLM